MIIEFNADTHEYFVKATPRARKKTKLISVTQLMKKHGLAPSYDFVDAETLELASKRGTLIHKEIETYNKTLEVGFTEEVAEYVAHVEYNGIHCLGSEVIVYNDIVAGTVDLLLEHDGTLIIADIKTTSTVHKDAVSWQLSIYNHLLGCEYKQAQVYHFDKDGKLKVVDIPFKPQSEVERLLDCERKGEIYKQDAIITTDQLNAIADAESIIVQAEEMKRQAEERLQEIRTALMEAMKATGVSSYSDDNVTISYIAPSTTTTLDSKAIKNELPEVYQKYSRTTERKEQIRIKLK